MGATIALAPWLPVVYAHGDGRATLMPAACSCGNHKPVVLTEDDARVLAGALLAAAEGLPITNLLKPQGGDN